MKRENDLAEKSSTVVLPNKNCLLLIIIHLFVPFWNTVLTKCGFGINVVL